jgi:F-type H+-transporting ATPase subunit b
MELKNPFFLEHPAEFSDFQWLLVRGIGFLLVFWIFWKFIRPMVTVHLVSRHEAIVQADHQVTSTLRETEEMRNDYQARLETIHDETRRRLDEAVHEAESLKEQILAEARQSVQAITRRGEDEVAREQAKAMTTLRNQFVEGVIGAARHAAANSVSENHHRRLIEEFTKDLATRS